MAEVVVLAFVAARFLVPLAIPRFPLPAILAALVLDAVDQTIFAAFDAEPANYQAYDKALDVYYLAIAYISTIRNWTDGVAFRIGQFLWYYRLVGVVGFELTGARTLLIVFPNTFEYFFIFYEAVRLRWTPGRLTRRHVIGAAAGIWIVIKLPQEWWIHVGRLDVTDVVSENPWIWPALVPIAAGVLLAVRRWAWPPPPADWSLSMDVDAHATTTLGAPADPPAGAWALINHPLTEKTVLVSLVMVVFFQLLPAVDAGVPEIAIGVALVVAANAGVGHLIGWRDGGRRTVVYEFLAVGAINVGVVLAARGLSRGDGGGTALGATFLGVVLLTLIVTLYDRYRRRRLTSITPG